MKAVFLTLSAALLTTACGDSFVSAAAIEKARNLCAPSDLVSIREDFQSSTRLWFDANCSEHSVRFFLPTP